MRIYNYIFLMAVLFTATSATAQHDWCLSDQYNQQMLESMSPEDARKILEKHHKLFEMASELAGRESGVVYTIPLVVHVIHDNCSGNISKEQIEDGIRILNEDFRRINSDTIFTRALFKPYASDAEIEFKLARIDPNGNCTEGINRINSELSNNANNSVKSLSSWPANKYMNVWLVNSIESGSGPGIILGYAQFPSFGPWNTYGLVVRNDSWGTIGTSNRDGRTASHEVGHCLGLYHTFQSGCESNCSTTGDRICDTPPSAQATYGCNSNQNTCTNDMNGAGSPYNSNVVDQIENYMSYDDCQNMFSQGQVDRMRATLTSISQLTQLVSSSNLVATGTNSGFVPQDCEPIADFCQEKISICEGESVTFRHESYNGPINSITWSFPGGSPTSSSSDVVGITYNSMGEYDATLTVGNSAGSDSKKLSKIVNVHSKTADFFDNWIYEEYFEDPGTFDDFWIVENPSGGRAWELTTKAAFSGDRSVYMNNNINGLDFIDNLITPSFKISTVKNPVLQFKVAFAKKTSTSEDKLTIYYSYTCGQFWSIFNVQNVNDLNSVNNTVFGDFKPKESEWKDIEVSLPNFVKSRDNVRFKFEFKSGGGNNIYLDDFKVRNATGIDEFKSIPFKVYPNPANEVINIDLGKFSSRVESIHIRDLNGKTLIQESAPGNAQSNVLKFNTTPIARGIYFVVVRSNEGYERVEKIVIQ